MPMWFATPFLRKKVTRATSPVLWGGKAKAGVVGTAVVGFVATTVGDGPVAGVDPVALPCGVVDVLAHAESASKVAMVNAAGRNDLITTG